MLFVPHYLLWPLHWLYLLGHICHSFFVCCFISVEQWKRNCFATLLWITKSFYLIPEPIQVRNHIRLSLCVWVEGASSTLVLHVGKPYWSDDCMTFHTTIAMAGVGSSLTQSSDRTQMLSCLEDALTRSFPIIEYPYKFSQDTFHWVREFSYTPL